MSLVYSGIQPSGELHVGNYFGAVKLWLELQDQYPCIFNVADYHALTSSSDAGKLRSRTREVVIDLLALGIDPEKSTLFVQSAVREHTELAWILFSLTPLGLLGKLPAFREKALFDSQKVNLGLLAYPVLQAADIMLYKASIIPVGEDQEMHINLAGDLIKKFNRQYKKLFPKLQILHSHDPRIMGLDGHSKMSKSQKNTIGLNDPSETILKKIKSAVTDPKRVSCSDCGNPLACSIYSLHKAVTSEEELEELFAGCTQGQIGCVECKQKLHQNLDGLLVPFRERKAELNSRQDYIDDVIHQGNKTCSIKAKETIGEVKEAIGLLTY